MAAGLSSALAAAAETLDRVVGSIGTLALTESDVEREFRFELFLEGQLPAQIPNAATYEQVRDRLIDQKLLLQEAEGESVKPGELAQKAAEGLAEVRKKYGSEEAFRSALLALGMDERQVLERLTEHEITLRIIDRRIRPDAWVERPEIEAYYHQTFLPDYTRRSGSPAPAVEEVEDQIREILVQQKIDQLLAEWLKELKARRRVRLLSYQGSDHWDRSETERHVEKVS